MISTHNIKECPIDDLKDLCNQNNYNLAHTIPLNETLTVQHVDTLKKTYPKHWMLIEKLYLDFKKEESRSGFGWEIPGDPNSFCQILPLTQGNAHLHEPVTLTAAMFTYQVEDEILYI